MRLFVLIFAGLCLWLKCVTVQAVIQNGVITFDAVPGASRYTLWRILPGQASVGYLGSVTTNRFAVGTYTGGTTFYVRTITPTNGGQFYVESDLGFVVTPPEAPVTNLTLRVTGQQTNTVTIQTWMGAGPWTDALRVPVTNKVQLFRALLPAPLPGGAP